MKTLAILSLLACLGGQTATSAYYLSDNGYTAIEIIGDKHGDYLLIPWVKSGDAWTPMMGNMWISEVRMPAPGVIRFRSFRNPAWVAYLVRLSPNKVAIYDPQNNVLSGDMTLSGVLP